MSKLSKRNTKLPEEVMALVRSDKILTLDERIWIADNFHPMAECNIGVECAYFTPFDLARELEIFCLSERTIDLCAGIGTLALACFEARPQNTGRDSHPGAQRDNLTKGGETCLTMAQSSSQSVWMISRAECVLLTAS